MRKVIMWLALSLLLPVFCGCTMLEELSRSDAQPDLRLLEHPVYEEAPPVSQTEEQSGILRVDLWLDATQVMGGINPAEDGIYPHSSRKYREGGFHYRYKNSVGMYETLLRCVLSGLRLM